MKATICLNMIVKDEAHVLRELFESLHGLIDHWVIVDTGSTDGTQELVRSWFAAKGVPGELHERPWRDFGHNRSEALRLADGTADYIWVIDADDKLHGRLPLDGLTHDCYSLRYGKAFSYWRRQLFRSGLEWRYVGVLHEVAESERARSAVRLEGDYHVESRRLGARSRDPRKYHKDAETLERALVDEPGNERYWFYLGQSWYDAGEPAKAKAAYEQRVRLGGWQEEAYCAQVRVGHCEIALGAPDAQVAQAFLAAHQMRPTRAEALHDLAHCYRQRRQWELGLLFAEAARAIPLPVDDVLFVRRDVYAFRALDEFATCAFYTARWRDGEAACRQLLALDLPPADRARIEQNLALYRQKAPVEAGARSTMRPYDFSNDWFGAAEAPSVWPRLAQYLPGKTAFLEIGSWEGRSTVWTAENLAALCGAQIVCVDSWQGGEEHDPDQMGGVYARFQANMAALEANRRAAGGDVAVRAVRGPSVQGLAQLLVEERRFDFCYVDGSHTARDTLTDACMAWALLKNGGVMVFDDYMWCGSPLLLNRPKPAVDAFTAIFGQELFVLHNGYQVAVQKRLR